MQNLNTILQALLAGIFTFGMTAIGCLPVFFKKEPNQRFIKSMLGFAAGVMIAASFWSLLAPAIAMSAGKILPKWFPVSIGFMAGSLFILLLDKILPHLHLGFSVDEKEGVKTRLQRNILFVLAVTLHNIPEGLAIGVAFGSIHSGFSSFAAAAGLAIGIGIQNISEGFAVAMPLRCEGLTCQKSFNWGLLSGIVEPIAAVFGAFAVTAFRGLLPYALSFAAGAMFYVVIEEVIPESQKGGDSDLATISALAGFVLMMILEVIFA